MPPQRSYLDHNATTPVRPEAARAVAAALALAGNASSVHGEGRAARKLIEDSREAVAALAGARAEQVVFTSGGTEANNLALRGALAAGLAERLMVSAVEHASILETAKDAGVPCEVVPVDAAGIVSLEALEHALAASPARALVAVMLANNETGVIEPLGEVARIAAGHGALVHCDAVQAAGKLPLDFLRLGVDFMSLSAHKLGGPQGIGALVVRDGLDLAAVNTGGGQERRRRGGTENLSGIAGFAAAAGARDGLSEMRRITRLRERLEVALRAATPEVVVFAGAAERVANTTAFALEGYAAESLLIAFDLEGIAVSSGSACSSGKVARSHVLTAQGVAPALAEAAVRVSLGWSSTVQDVDRFIAAWRKIVARQRAPLAA